MNNKNYITIISIVNFSTSLMCYSQITKTNAIQIIDKFKANQDYDKFHEFYFEIIRDKSLSEEVKIELYARILVITNDYLERHSIPKEIPQINIDPGNGSLSGIDPSHIKDPTVRANYEKAITANNILAEAHIKHGRFTDMRDKIIDLCVLFENAKAENKKLISDAILVASGNPETTKKILGFIKKQKTNNSPK